MKEKEEKKEEPCWMCHDKGTIEEPICAWCVEGVPHSNCDDTWFQTVKCPVCFPEEQFGIDP
jgi:hypothetical protein